MSRLSCAGPDRDLHATAFRTRCSHALRSQNVSDHDLHATAYARVRHALRVDRGVPRAIRCTKTIARVTTAAHRRGLRSCVPSSPQPIVAIEIRGAGAAGPGSIDGRRSQSGLPWRVRRLASFADANVVIPRGSHDAPADRRLAHLVCVRYERREAGGERCA